MDKPTPLSRALDEARRALGSEHDVRRLRDKLGALPPLAAEPRALTKTASGATKLVIGAAVGTVVLAAVIAWLSHAPSAPKLAPRPPVHHEAAPVPQAAAPAPTPVAPMPPVAGEQAPAIEPAPKLAPRRRKLGNEAPATAPARPAAAQAPKELELLTAAQDAIDSSPRRALTLLDEHARLYADGDFALERESLAIEALRKLGRISAAQARAHAFVARFPNAPNATQLQRWLDESSTADHKEEARPLPTR